METLGLFLKGTKRQPFYRELIVGLLYFITCTSFSKRFLSASGRRETRWRWRGWRKKTSTGGGNGVRGNNCRKTWSHLIPEKWHLCVLSVCFEPFIKWWKISSALVFIFTKGTGMHGKGNASLAALTWSLPESNTDAELKGGFEMVFSLLLWLTYSLWCGHLSF